MPLVFMASRIDMPRPRSQQVCTSDTPYYHCMSRCVRRAFLCGQDQQGNDYNHRRQWLEDRIRLLASVFSIDICSYAVMSNHYHIVVKIGSAADWSDEQVIQHWLALHRGPLIIQRFNRGLTLTPAEHRTVDDIVRVWRHRLQDLSWFMKCLNEPIAKQANREDNCTGHFWESRFVSQALLTEEALLSCMAYVDLNPVRANIAATPEQSDHTSLKERVEPTFNLAEAIKGQPLPNPFELPVKPLLHFDDAISNTDQRGIAFSLSDYLQLVDWTGRAIRDDKAGHIGNHLPPILTRLGISPADWLQASTAFEAVFRRRFQHAA